ncbi:unnamed protein product [Closterium sp. NIES-53]
MFIRHPGSSLYTLTAEPPQVVASAQVSVSGQVAAPCSCRLLSHQTLLWHHRLGHPSLPRLRGMHSRLLVSGLPMSLPPLPPLPTPPCLPCVEGRQHAAPHSSSFSPTTAPLQTLHMDVWGLARVSGQDYEPYFLLVVDDYTRYTTVFPLRRKSEDLPVLRLHSYRGGEFSSDLLRDFCRGEGILQSFMLPASPQQNGVAECRIGLDMEVARTSMIHAATPHFLWSFAVRYAAHQLNLWPRVSLPETSPTLRWMGKVGDASVFRVSGSHAFVCNSYADKLSSRAIPYVFNSFPPDTPGWQFNHPTSCCVLPSQDVMFDESVPFYRLFPYRTAPLPPPPPLFLAPGPPLVDPLPPQGPAFSGAASGGDASGGAESEGAESRGAEPEGTEPGGTEPEGGEPGGAKSEGAESRGAEPRGTASAGGLAGASTRLSHRREPLSPQQLRTHVRSGVAEDGGAAIGGTGVGGAGAASRGGACTSGTGAAGAGGAGGAGARDPCARGTGAGNPGAGGTGAGNPGAGGIGARDAVASKPGGAGVTTRAGGPGGARAAGPGGARTRVGGAGAGGTRAGGAGAGGAGAGDPGAGDPGAGSAGAGGAGAGGPGGGGTVQLRPFFVPPQPSSLPPPYSVLRPVLSHTSSLCDFPYLARAASPTVPCLLASVVTVPSFESTATSALVAELVDFAAACSLDYTTSLVAEFESDCLPSVGDECALGTDVLEYRQEEFECLAAAVPHLVAMLLAPEGDPDAPDIPTPRSYAEAITSPYSFQWQTPMDAEMASWKVKRPPGSPPVFKARYVARCFSQRQGVDYFQTFSPTSKMTTLCIAFLQGSLHEEIWLRRPPGFTRSFPAGNQWSLRRPVYGFRQTPREWHDTLRTTLAALEFAPSTFDPSLRDTPAVTWVLQRFGFRYSSPQSTPLPTDHSLSAPPSDESVEPSGPYPELVGCLMYLMTCTRPDLAYPLSILARYVAPWRHKPEHREAAKRVLRYLCSTSGMGLVLGGRGPVVLTRHADASWVDDLATQQSSQCYTFSLGSGSVSWWSTRSSSVLSFICEAEIYAGAMAAQELRWLTYLLTDLGERPPVLYADNKAMIALCQEHRMEHRTKHIALCYFLARELQQRGQLHLAYMATRANTADIFTKALQPACPHGFIHGLTYESCACDPVLLEPVAVAVADARLEGTVDRHIKRLHKRCATEGDHRACQPEETHSLVDTFGEMAHRLVGHVSCPALPRAALLPRVLRCPSAAGVPCPAQRYRALPCHVPMHASLPSTRACPVAPYPRVPRCPAPARALLPRARANLAAQRSHTARTCPAPRVCPAPPATACLALRRRPARCHVHCLRRLHTSCPRTAPAALRRPLPALPALPAARTAASCLLLCPALPVPCMRSPHCPRAALCRPARTCLPCPHAAAALSAVLRVACCLARAALHAALRPLPCPSLHVAKLLMLLLLSCGWCR